MRFQEQEPKSRDSQIAEKDLESLVTQGYNVHLRGTEILLDPDYLSLFPLVRQKYIQTNGKLLYEDHSLFEELKKNKIKTIMLTYPTEPRDLLDFSADMVESVIKKCSFNDFRTIVDFIITKAVFKEFKKDKKYFDNLLTRLINTGTNELRFVRLIPLSNKLKMITPSYEEAREIIEESVRLEAAYDKIIDITRAGQFGFFDLRRRLKKKYFGIEIPEPEKTGIMDCPGGERLYIIDLHNNIYPCLYLMNRKYKIGKFKKGQILLNKGIIIPAKIHIEDCPAHSLIKS